MLQKGVKSVHCPKIKGVWGFGRPVPHQWIKDLPTLEPSRGKKWNPGDSLLTIHPLRPQGKILRPSARLPEHSPLPAVGFTGPLGRCSKPQAGIAASRHRCTSSASLLLLLSKSLMVPLGAATLNHRKGLWGAPPRPYKTAGKAQGIVGIVVLSLRPPLVAKGLGGFLKRES